MSALPVIDVGPLTGVMRDEDGAAAAVADQIFAAARDVGFFYVTGHGITTLPLLRADAEVFFALPAAEKLQVDMCNAGSAWRGYFPVGAELTSGKVDQKEGLYFGVEGDAQDGRPLHGPNQWPERPPTLRDSVVAHMAACRQLGGRLLAALARGQVGARGRQLCPRLTQRQDGPRPPHFSARF